MFFSINSYVHTYYPDN